MTTPEIITALAVLVSPLFAVQASEWFHRWREKRQRRLIIFRTLMSTRATRLSADHVQALNVIDIEFNDRKSRGVRDAWSAYLNHLNTTRTDAGATVWDSTKDNLFVELLYEMAHQLGYPFNKTHIRTTAYYPKGYSDLEADQYVGRKALLAILSGERSVPIRVTSIPGEPSAGPSLPPPPAPQLVPPTTGPSSVGMRLP
jgi:hypothetical protein